MTFKLFLHNSAKKIAWLLPFISFLMGYYAIDVCFYQSLIKTPPLIGKPLTEALEVLAHHNLNAKLIGYKEDLLITPGTIISQNPSESSSIRAQQTVFLVVSAIPKKQQIPHCVGLSYSAILDQLKEQGMSHTAHHVPSNYPQGICIAQSPEMSSKESDKELLLYVSKGNSCGSFLMPSLTNIPVTQVTAFLTENNLSFALFHSKEIGSDHLCTSCKVVAQKPSAGSPVQKKSTQTIQLQVND